MELLLALILPAGSHRSYFQGQESTRSIAVTQLKTHQQLLKLTGGVIPSVYYHIVTRPHNTHLSITSSHPLCWSLMKHKAAESNLLKGHFVLNSCCVWILCSKHSSNIQELISCFRLFQLHHFRRNVCVVGFCKRQICRDLTFQIFHFYVLWLRSGQVQAQKHLLRVWKRTCCSLKWPVVSSQTRLENVLMSVWWKTSHWWKWRPAGDGDGWGPEESCASVWPVCSCALIGYRSPLISSQTDPTAGAFFWFSAVIKSKFTICSDIRIHLSTTCYTRAGLTLTQRFLSQILRNLFPSRPPWPQSWKH